MTDRVVDKAFDVPDQARDFGTTVRSLPRTVAMVILTAAVVLGGLYLLWQARAIVGWCIGGAVIAAALDPAVKLLQKHHVKRSTAVLLIYVVLVLGGLGIVGLILPPLVEQIRGLTAVGLDPATQSGQVDRLFGDVANQLGLTLYLPRLNEWLQSLSGQLTTVLGGLLSYTAGALSFVSSLTSMLFIGFYFLLDGQRIVDTLLKLIPQAQRSLLQSLLAKSADAISNYVTGNVIISVICGVAVFVVLELLHLPFAGALALLVAILDLIPQVGATLAGVVLVLAGLFISPFKSLVILGYFVVYQQVENYLLTPLIYGRRVQLHPLTIFLAVVLGGVWLGVPGALLAIPAAEILRSIVAEWLAGRAIKS